MKEVISTPNIVKTEIISITLNAALIILFKNGFKDSSVLLLSNILVNVLISPFITHPPIIHIMIAPINFGA